MLNKKEKKTAITLGISFLALTLGISGSAYLIHNVKQKQQTQEMKEEFLDDLDGLSRNIVETDSETISSNFNSDNYVQIGENVYIVTYDSYDEAVEKAENNDIANATSEMDTVFQTASDEDLSDGLSDDSDDDAYYVEPLQEGYTARQLADEQGKKLVAVIDTGSNVGTVQTVNFTTDEDVDNNGHGTAMVKKIMDNANGNAVIVSLKAINDSGKGLLTNVYQAVRWAIDNNVDVINMSISAYDDGNQTIFKNLIKEAIDKGITVVASAGNYNSNVSSYIPANIDGVITVGTYTNNDGSFEKTDTSNYGNITYYEEENSTSEATAKVTGMIVSGADMSQEKTSNDVTYDESKVEKEDVNISDVEAQATTQHMTVQIYEGYGKVTMNTTNVTYSTTNSMYVTGENIANNANNWWYGYFYPANGYKNSYSYCSGLNTSYSNSAAGYANSNNNYVNTDNPAYRFVVPGSSALMQVHFAQTYIKINTNGGTMTNGLSAGTAYYSGGRGSSATLSASGRTETGINATIDLGTPTREGYIFSSWSVSGGGWMDGNTYHYGTSDATVTAQWYPASKDAAGTVNITEKTFTENLNYDSKTNVKTYKTYDVSDANKWGQQATPSFTKITYNGSNSSTVSLNGVPGVEKLFIPINTTKGQKYYINFEYTIPTSASLYGTDDNPVLFSVLSSKPRLNTDQQSAESANSNKLDEDRRLASTKLSQGTNTANLSFTATGETTYLVFYLGGYTDGSASTFTFTNFITSTIANPVTLSTPTRTGYKLLNWNTKANGNGTSYNAGSTVNLKIESTDNVYYAQWQAQTFSATLSANVGTWNGSSYTYTKSSSLINFKESSSGKGRQVATVDYKANTGSGYVTQNDTNANTSKVLCDTTVTINDLKMANGYKFEKFTGTGATSNTSTSFTMPSSAVETVLQARGVSYTVVFDKNSVKGENGVPNDNQTVLATGSMGSQTLHYGSSETLKTNTFTWEGHKFLGWSTNKNATTPDTYNGSTLTDKATGFWDFFGALSNVHEDGKTVTLYAVWSTNSAQVTFDADSSYFSASNNSTTTQKWGTSLTIKNPTVKSLKTTIKYNLNSGTWSDGTSSAKTDTSTLTFNKWVVCDTKGNTQSGGSYGYLRNSTTYVFGANNAKLKATYYYTNVTLPTPKRTNYTFAGWYSDANLTKFVGNGGDTYSGNGTKNQTVQLYAYWVKNTYNYTDTLDYTIKDKTDTSDRITIRKIDTKGNILTKINNQGFVMEICEGSSYNSSNVVYTLNTARGILDKSGKVVIALNSDKYDKTTGAYTITSLLTKGKTYSVKETKAAPGYSLDTTVQTFTYSDTNNQIDLVFKDEKFSIDRGEYSFKTNQTGQAIKGAEFALYVINSDNSQTVVWTGTTNNKGNFENDFVTALQVGEKMRIVETKAPAGYKAIDITFTVPVGWTPNFEEYDKAQELKFISEGVVDEDKTANLRIHKTDNDGNAIKGTEFKLYVKGNDDALYEARYIEVNGAKCIVDPLGDKYESATPYATVTTDSNGYATFNKIRTMATYFGTDYEEFTKTYYIAEVKASDGYALNGDYIEVTLSDEDSTTQTFEVKDNKITTITLNTGGNGINAYMYGGLSLFLVSALAMVKTRKKHI